MNKKQRQQLGGFPTGLTVNPLDFRTSGLNSGSCERALSKFYCIINVAYCKYIVSIVTHIMEVHFNVRNDKLFDDSLEV